jgi:hypothetical protein
MRISQIKTLCWTANVLVLAGAAYVGMHFWETYKGRSTRAEVVWPEEDGDRTIDKRWPGEVSSFRPIWETPVNGLVPKPPEPEKPREVERDLGKIFLSKYTYLTSIDALPEPDDSVAYIRVPGTDVPTTLRTGESLDGFTLIGFELSDARGEDAIVFSNPKVEGLVRMKRAEEPVPPVIEPPLVEEVALKDATELAGPDLELSRIPRRAYQDLLADASGLTWQVPVEELRWWGEFGESDVLGKLVVNVAKSPDGTARGIKLMSQPGAGTGASDGRGLTKGDTILSINGVPITAKEDILRYLRGDGHGLLRYEVVVEGETGIERTLIYNVDRVRRRVPRR